MQTQESEAAYINELTKIQKLGLILSMTDENGNKEALTQDCLNHKGNDIETNQLFLELSGNIICLKTESGTSDNAKSLRTLLAGVIGGQPNFTFSNGNFSHYILKAKEGCAVPLNSDLPKGMEILKAGDLIPLPKPGKNQKINVRLDSLDALPEFNADALPLHGGAEILQLPVAHKARSLDEFDVVVDCELLKEQAVDAEPVLGEVGLAGQLTVWYAEPNTGKTLLALHLIQQAMEKYGSDYQYYYVNADDNSKGISEKADLFADCGVKMLVPGHKGFSNKKLPELLAVVAAEKSASNAVVIIDTMKQFVDLMNKTETTNFVKICRNFAMAGGTIIGLAHTGKNLKADGTPQYAGTTDVIEGFDAAYIASVIEEENGIRLVKFENKKRRGANPQSVLFRYKADQNLSYAERLASVEQVDHNEVERLQATIRMAKDSDVILMIQNAIEAGSPSKMEMAKGVANTLNIGRNQVVRIIEQYEGNDPAVHLWYSKTVAHGRKVYSRHPAVEAAAA